MAKLRRNYESNSNDVSVNVRIFIFAVIPLGLLYFGWDYLIQYTGSGEGKQIILKTTEGVVNPQIDSNDPRNSNNSNKRLVPKFLMKQGLGFRLLLVEPSSTIPITAFPMLKHLNKRNG